METKDIIIIVATTTLLTSGLVSLFFFLILRKRKKQNRDKAEMQKALLGIVLEAQELERNRLGEDLHDELGPMLTALRWKTRNFSLTENTHLNEEVQSFNNMIDHAIEKVRQVSRNLMSPVLIEKGLIIAIREANTQLEKSTPLKINLETTLKDIRLCKTKAMQVFRILMELCAHAVRRAGTGTLSIHISLNDGLYVFSITDTPNGEILPNTANDEGISLKNILARASYIDGSFTFQKQEEGGTKAVLKVPPASNFSHI